MARIIVVGAGIAGSCVTRIARERGHEVTVVAREGVPDSVAATTVLRKAYHLGKPEELAAWEYAVECYEHWGVRMQRGGQVKSYRAPMRDARGDGDWLLMEPEAPLVKPDVVKEVVSVHGERVWYGPGRGDRADAVIAACGATGALAAPGDVTWGVTWLHSPEALRHPEKIEVYQYAPYRTIVCGVAGGRARVGSSSGVSRERAVEQAEKMLKTAWDLGWLTTDSDWEMRLGARLKRDPGERTWREEDGSWGISGFHRTGYALAPAAARDLLDEIDKDLAAR